MKQLSVSSSFKLKWSSLLPTHAHATRSISSRSFSSSSSSSSSSFSLACEKAVSSLRDRGREICHDRIDLHQSKLLALTLSSMLPNYSTPFFPTPTSSSLSSSSSSNLLPYGYHLVYHPPQQLTSELASDGTDTTFNPPKSTNFIRRMWAGGHMTFHPNNPLCLYDETTEETEIERVEKKRTAQGDEMIVVWVNKLLKNQRGIVCNDQRSWLFRPPLHSPTLSTPLHSSSPFSSPSASSSSSSSSPPPPPPLPAAASSSSSSSSSGVSSSSSSLSSRFPVLTHGVCQNRSSLFRFSALTFNAHAIHLSRSWCREHEGQPDMVVHGPLNILLLLQFWQLNIPVFLASHSLSNSMLQLNEVTYRAVRPVFVDEAYTLNVQQLEEEEKKEVEGNRNRRGDESTFRAWVAKQDGQVAMEAKITATTAPLNSTNR